ncbi:MAG: N-acetylmuramoyl-L-alanine amidase [Rhodobacter sp.]|nr:N-acetylmuramoyl-L-alanine amidase [Rhodobacter sp.]
MGPVRSPNFGERRGGVAPDLVVLHYTAMPSCAAALERLCDPLAEVSAHYLICEAGDVLALVPERARAWHAGAGSWGAVTDVNSHSIGVELANDGLQPFAAPQMTALEFLLGGILARWSIPPHRVIGAARTFGYPDVPFDILLRAVRLRFRPWGVGPLDAVDMGIMLDLARRFPVDAGGVRP